jgi:hypothetical protein
LDAIKIVFSPDGKSLASLDAQTGDLCLWALPRLGAASFARLSARQIERLWKDLGAADACQAYRAMAALIAMPEQALRLLEQQLHPAKPVTRDRLKQLVTQLDDDSFDVRERAMYELASLGKAAESVLHSAVAKETSLEVRTRVKWLLGRINTIPREQLRILRAVEVLEAVGTPPAHLLLDNLARGGRGAFATEEARKARSRLRERQRRPLAGPSNPR